ncbi:MAG: hypothetical protein ACRD68_17805, partial [Pyrinomonadaceae bacterium]
LPRVLDHASDIVFYLGGADPFAGDKLGRLALTIPGLRERDEFVLDACRKAGTPVVTVMSGGYAADINDTVEIHCNTIRAVRTVFPRPSAVGQRISEQSKVGIGPDGRGRAL